MLNWVGLFPPIPPIDKTMQHFITRKHEKNVNVFGSNFTPFPNLLATRKWIWCEIKLTFLINHTFPLSSTHSYIHVSTPTTHPLSFCLLALMLLHTLPLKLLSRFWEPMNKKKTWHKNKSKLSWICSYKVTLFLANEICIMRFIVFVALPCALALP